MAKESQRRKPGLSRTVFRTRRLLDFCTESGLIAECGHQVREWPLVVLKELIANSADACEDQGIPPEIEVTVNNKGITVADNGPGLSEDTVKGVLDFDVRVSSREAYISPTRGAQGNALKTIVAVPYVLHGESGRVIITSQCIRHEIDIRIDRLRQVPQINHQKRSARNAKNGTSVQICWPDSASSLLLDAKERFLQIADDYTLLNPHLTLLLDWFGKRHTVKATDPAWKKWLPSYPICIHWYNLEQFEQYASACITHDADSGTDRKVREFVAEFDNLSSTAKQKRVLEATGLARAALSALREGNGLDHELTAKLLAAMKLLAKPVEPKHLGVIGKDHLRTKFESLGCEMESFQYQKQLGFDREGLPFVAEVAFAWRPDTERRFIAGVNWSPGILNPFRELGKAGRSLDSVLQEQRSGPDEPIVFLLHLTCPRLLYTDRGKSAVAFSHSAS